MLIKSTAFLLEWTAIRAATDLRFRLSFGHGSAYNGEMPRRSYLAEIDRLPQAYESAMQADIADIARALDGWRGKPLIAVGSGGSYSAAHFAARLHETIIGTLARAATPLEVVSELPSASVGALLLSAGGRNPDALAAFRALARRDDIRPLVLCCEPDSLLARLATRHSRASLVSVRLPFGRDGYLATSSLLSSALVLGRAYEAVTDHSTIPLTLADLLQNDVGVCVAELRKSTALLWQRLSTVVLYDPLSSPGATDLESKLVESALGAVLLSDFRNFAHGRHLWLARNGDTTGLIALASQSVLSLAQRTLDLIPSTIPSALVRVEHNGPAGMIESLVLAMLLTAAAAASKGIEVGQPRVPKFGRQLYHLRAVPARTSGKNSVTSTVASAIARKRSASADPSVDWTVAYDRFVARLCNARFGALVLDYDGTLSDGVDRFRGVSNSVRAPLIKLLRSGLVVGVATGRGTSAGEALRRALPRRFHDSVFVGYYQGAVIAPLGDADAPRAARPPDESLASVGALLTRHARISSMATIAVRRFQITANLNDPAQELEAWALINDVVATRVPMPLSVLRSRHSIDIVPPGVTKRLVVDAVQTRLGSTGGDVLCVGDRGGWPGNDATLLAGEFALSVDEVSSDPSTCWHLAPEGIAGVDATAYYLRRLAGNGAQARFSPPDDRG